MFEKIHFFCFFVCFIFIYGCIGSSLLHVGFSCGEWWLLFIAVCRLFTVVASLVVEHGLYLGLWA